MRSIAKLAAVVELVLLLLTFAGVAVSSPTVATAGHCPLHRQSPASPAPVKGHSCCQSGPESAVLPKVAPRSRDLESVRLVHSEPIFHVADRFIEIDRSDFADGAPPTNLQLRI